MCHAVSSFILKDTDMEIQIESGIAAPNDGLGQLRGREPKYPFQKMNVGDSFVLDQQSNHASARVCAIQYAARSGKRFATRTIDNGLRIWRIA